MNIDFLDSIQMPDNSENAGNPNVPDEASASLEPIELKEEDANKPAEESTDSKDGDKENIGDAPKEEDEQDKLLKELKEAAEEQPNDSKTIRHLRSLLKTKLDNVSLSTPKETENVEESNVDNTQQEAIDFYNSLFGFDTAQGKPTSKDFVTKVAEKDFSLASQTFSDFTNLEIPDSPISGWTLGHEYLKSIGLDPFKIEELRQVSNGEIPASNYGLEDIPEHVPDEYRQAYKNLSKVVKDDIDIYLNSDKPEQKAAAIQILQDRNATLQAEEAKKLSENDAKRSFELSVIQEVDTRLEQTFDGLLEAIKVNKVYSDVKLSSNEIQDRALKDAIIIQLNGIGEENPIMVKRSLGYFDKLGVKIDINKVNELLTDIRENTKIIVQAEKLGQRNNVSYATQIQAAKTRKTEAEAATLALANKYFSDSVTKLSSGKKVIDFDPAGGLPPVEGENRQTSTIPGVKSLAELDSYVLALAKQNQELANSSK